MQVKAQVKPPGGALPPSGKDEVDSLICTVDRSLSDCIKLLEEVSVREGWGGRGGGVRATLHSLTNSC